MFAPYKETLKHINTFGITIPKTDYAVLTHHDVLGQLLLRELAKTNEARYATLVSRFNSGKAEQLLLKTVYLRPIYGTYNGNRVHVGWSCSKKKIRAWFRRNLNRMLGC